MSYISNNHIDIKELRKAVDEMSGRAYIKDLAKKSRNGTLSTKEKKTLEFMRNIERFG